MNYFETRKMTFSRNSIKVLIAIQIIKLLKYGEYAYYGECDGIVFMSNEPFTGAIKSMIFIENGKYPRLSIPTSLSDKFISKDFSYLDFYEDNGDIFFIPRIDKK